MRSMLLIHGSEDAGEIRHPAEGTAHAEGGTIVIRPVVERSHG